MDSASDSASGADAPALSEELCCSDWDRLLRLATARPPTPSTMTAAAAAPARGSQRRRRGTTLLGRRLVDLVLAGASGGATALGNEQGERVVEPGLDLGRDRFAVGAGPELGEQCADARVLFCVDSGSLVTSSGSASCSSFMSAHLLARVGMLMGSVSGVGPPGRARWARWWVCRGAGSPGRVS